MKDDAELGRLLRSSKLEIGVPSDFQAQVWQKIALRSDQRLGAGIVSLWERVLGGLAQPRVGFSAAAVVMLAGIALGQIQASADVRQAWSSLEGRYVASIDPYAQSGHGLHR